MPHGATAQAPPRLSETSVRFQGHDALAQLPKLAPKLLDFLAQLGHGPHRISELRGPAGIRCQECALALVAHSEAICRQLPDGSASDGHCHLVCLLELSERGELSGIGELATAMRRRRSSATCW